jgi:hypothetical protein
MNYLYLRGFFVYIFLTLFFLGTSSAQSSFKSSSKKPEKALFGTTFGSKKKSNTKEPRTVSKAKRKQEKNEKRLKKESAEYIEQSRKRAYDIQSPEVKERMKQNQKDTAIRDKEKKKKVRATTKKAGKKYN